MTLANGVTLAMESTIGLTSVEILSMARGSAVTADDLERARTARQAFDGMRALTFPSPL